MEENIYNNFYGKSVSITKIIDFSYAAKLCGFPVLFNSFLVLMSYWPFVVCNLYVKLCY